MGDPLYSAWRYRIFSVIDEGNREAMAIAVDVSMPSERALTVLNKIVAIHGAPRRIRCGNGPELLARSSRVWCERQGGMLVFIQPGKRNQNACIDRLNRTNRIEILSAWVFMTLDEVRDLSEAWRKRYNTERMHDSLVDVPPIT